MNRQTYLALIFIAATFGLGNSCDAPQIMPPANAGEFDPNQHGGPADNFGQPGQNGTQQPGNGGTQDGTQDGTTSAAPAGTACQHMGECGGGMACVSGVCETESVLVVSMTWEANTDLDLHLIQPNGEEVYYRNRETRDGARFAQDACIADRCEPGTERREIIRYHSFAPGGEYRVFAVNYDGQEAATATVEVIYEGQTETFTLNLGAQAGEESHEITFDVAMMDAPCTVNVAGYGEVDLENDYIPNVIACENGNAPPEALRAAAIMARGFAYYKTKIEGKTVLQNSEADQVYRCSYRPNGAGPEHYAAARATTGQHPRWRGHIIAPFYVAGNEPPNPNAADPVNSCKGTGGINGVGTEGLVTYNYGKFDCDIEMSDQGWVTNPCTRNPHNRGTASQNGQACLANFGWAAPELLEYYYGADIEMSTADFCAN